MRKLVALCALSTASILAAPALAQEQRPGAYFQVNAGAGIAGNYQLKVVDSVVGSARGSEDTKLGPFLSVATGRSMAGGFAVEIEGLYLQNKADTSDIDAFLGFPLDARAKTYAVMVNGMYAIGRAGPLVPYVGAGIGLGKSTYKVLGASASDSGVVYQVRAGFAVPASDTMTWDLGYRYLEAPQAKKTYSFDDGSGGTEVLNASAKTKQHILTVGARWRY